MCVCASVVWVHCNCLFFFKQKTAYEMRISDWSSDVCSSDLRVADVHVAIRVRRSVVEDELLAALAAFANLRFEIALEPFGENRRFLLRQAGLHRKVGIGQEDGIAVIRSVGHGASRSRRLLWAQSFLSPLEERGWPA